MRNFHNNFNLWTLIWLMLTRYLSRQSVQSFITSSALHTAAKLRRGKGSTTATTTAKAAVSIAPATAAKAAYNYGPLLHTKLSKQLWKTIVKPGDVVIDATCGNGNDAFYIATLLGLDQESTTTAAATTTTATTAAKAEATGTEIATAAASGVTGTVTGNSTSTLHCIDVQQAAIDATRWLFASQQQCSKALQRGSIQLHCQSHEHFPAVIAAGSVTLIVYNLGYLPGLQRTRGDVIAADDTAATTAATATTDASAPSAVDPTTTAAAATTTATTTPTAATTAATTTTTFVRTGAESTVNSLRRAALLLREGGMISVTAYSGHPGGAEELQAVQEFFSEMPAADWRVYSSAPLNRPTSPVLFNAFKIEKFGYIKTKQQPQQ